MKKRRLTEEQQDAVIAFRDGYNVLVNSVAGSGKSTVATFVIADLKRRGDTGNVTYICFNKSIQEEMTNKLSKGNLDNGRATTIHSLGVSILRSTGKRVSVNAYKTSKMGTELMARWDSYKTGMPKNKGYGYLFHIKLMLEFARYNLHTNFDFNMVLDMYQEMQSSINFKKMKKEVLEDLFYHYVELYKEFTFPNGGRSIVIDFTDMYYLPVFLKLKLDIDSSYLIMDEVQDFNATQHFFIQSIIKDSKIKQFMAVGDVRQSIYGFSGSDPRLFANFTNYPNTVSKTISLNFRCGYDIINKANEVYNNLQAFKTNPGEVRSISSLNDIGDGSMVLGRKTSTLLKACFNLLGFNRPVYVKGEDILSNINRILNTYYGNTLEDIRASISRKVAEEADPLFGNTNDLYKYREDRDIVEELIKYKSFHNMPKKQIVERMTELTQQSEEEGAIMLCSIHRAKGLEENEVTILNEHEINPKDGASQFQVEQEFNLRYVAYTRAKELLNFIYI